MDNKKRGKKITAFIVLLVILVFGIFFARATLIHNVYCSNQFGECSSETKEFLTTLLGSNYFHFKSNAISTLKNKYSAQDVRFFYYPFNKVNVFVLEQTPDFAVTSDMQNFALVDNSGRVLSVQNATALPLLIKRDSQLSAGMEIDSDMIKALKILEYIFYTFNTKQIEVENGYIKANIENAITVYMSPSNDTELEIGKLVFVLSRLKAGGEENTISLDQIQEIDLRYKSPILRKE